jgi:phosphatidate cytidylyltransferase
MHFFKTNNFYQRCVVSLLGFPLAAFCFFYTPIFFCVALISALLFILMYEWSLLFDYSTPYFFLKTALYPIMPFGLLIFLYLFFRTDLAFLWAYVCLFDTSCYLIGNLFGTTSITPISPKKTWEGLIGGIVVSELLFFIFLKYLFFQSYDYRFFLFYFCISLLAFCGDLFESLLKRNAGIKNSSELIPGHGGLLDRLDSIFFVATGYMLYLFLHCVIMH